MQESGLFHSGKMAKISSDIYEYIIFVTHKYIKHIHTYTYAVHMQINMKEGLTSPDIISREARCPRVS